MRVAEQAVVFPALPAARAFFAFEQGFAAVLAVAADRGAVFVDGVGGFAAGAGGRVSRRVVFVEGDVEGYGCGARGEGGGGEGGG